MTAGGPGLASGGRIGDAGAMTGTRVWVVGIDGSEDSLTALSWAVDQAQRSDDPPVVRVVGAWNVPVVAPIGVAGTSVLVEWSEVARGVDEQLRAAVDSVDGDRRITIEHRVVQGGATRALLDESTDAARLIVGSRGRSGFKELVLGSVSRQCATHSTVPVVVVPATTSISPIERVVLGFDGSEHSCDAARWLLADVDLAAADILAVGAFDISPFDDPELTRARFVDEVEAAEAEFHRGLDDIDPTRRMRRSFSLHGARRALAEAFDPTADRPVDLVVLGARGRGTIGSALLGSVSNWVLHHVPCPLVIVPSSHR